MAASVCVELFVKPYGRHGFDAETSDAGSGSVSDRSDAEAQMWRRVFIDVLPTDTIMQMKQKLQQTLGVDPRLQLLSVGRKQLLEESHVGGSVQICSWGEFGLGADATLQLTDYSALAPQRASNAGHRACCCRIPETKDRGITVAQLTKLLKFVKGRSTPDGVVASWYDSRTGEAIRFDSINLYHVDTWILRPVTYEEKCSFVEWLTLNAAEQIPSWFVSHWWGEPVENFIQCLRIHQRIRNIKPAYWVCAYCNNQHELGVELSPNPCETSFYKAMQQCMGVVLVLDDQATPFTRIWCSFEASLCITNPALKFDIATIVPGAWWTEDDVDSEAAFQGELDPDFDEDAFDMNEADYGWLLIDVADRDHDLGRGQSYEEGFPLGIFEKALTLQVENANATAVIDKVRILNSIAGAREEDLDKEPQAEHEAYLRINRKLRARYALPGLRLAFDTGSELIPTFCRALREDIYTKKREFKFQMAAFDDDRLRDLATALSPQLEELLLDFEDAPVGDEGLCSLGKELPANLKRLVVKLRKNTMPFNFGPAAYNSGVMKAAYVEREQKAIKVEVSDEGISSIVASGLLDSLQDFKLTLGGFQNLKGLGLQNLARAACASRNLVRLSIYTSDCIHIDSSALAGFRDGLSPRLQRLELCLQGCSVGQDGMMDLSQGMSGSNLIHFILRLSQSTPFALSKLVRSFPKRLEAAHLSFGDMTDAGLAVIAQESLPDSLLELHLVAGCFSKTAPWDTQAEVEDYRAFARSLPSGLCKLHLEVSRSFFTHTSGGVELFADDRRIDDFFDAAIEKVATCLPKHLSELAIRFYGLHPRMVERVERSVVQIHLTSFEDVSQWRASKTLPLVEQVEKAQKEEERAAPAAAGRFAPFSVKVLPLVEAPAAAAVEDAHGQRAKGFDSSLKSGSDDDEMWKQWTAAQQPGGPTAARSIIDLSPDGAAAAAASVLPTEEPGVCPNVDEVDKLEQCGPDESGGSLVPATEPSASESRLLYAEPERQIEGAQNQGQGEASGTESDWRTETAIETRSCRGTQCLSKCVIV